MNICRAAICLLLFPPLAVPYFSAKSAYSSNHFASVPRWQVPSAPAQSPPPATRSKNHPTETGYAAFYSNSLEGHKTACGGVYSPTELTAAHPKLPCGTKLRVTNLRNGKSVRVTVNDHGPFSAKRIIDLSYAAAQSLDFIPQGTTLVKVEVLR